MGIWEGCEGLRWGEGSRDEGESFFILLRVPLQLHMLTFLPPKPPYVCQSNPSFVHFLPLVIWIIFTSPQSHIPLHTHTHTLCPVNLLINEGSKKDGTLPFITSHHINKGTLVRVPWNNIWTDPDQTTKVVGGERGKRVKSDEEYNSHRLHSCHKFLYSTHKPN